MFQRLHCLNIFISLVLSVHAPCFGLYRDVSDIYKCQAHTGLCPSLQDIDLSLFPPTSRDCGAMDCPVCGGEVFIDQYEDQYQCRCLKTPVTRPLTQWIRCSEKGIYPGYFSPERLKYKTLLTGYLEYCKANDECTCYWPELKRYPAALNNLAYKEFDRLFSETALRNMAKNIRAQEEFLGKYCYFSKHGLVVTMVCYGFFYSSYREILHDLEMYARTHYPFEEIHEILCTINEIQETLHYYFEHLYRYCFSKHPSQRVEQEIALINFDQGNNYDAEMCVGVLRPEVRELQNPNRNSTASEIYLMQGIVLNEALLYDQAIMSLDEAIKLNPNNVIAFQERAIAHFELSQIDESIGDYLSAKDMFSSPPFKSIPKAPEVTDQDLIHRNSSIGDYLAFSTGLAEGIVRGGGESVADFIPVTLSSLRGLSLGLWAFTKAPVKTSEEFAHACTLCIDYVREHTAGEIVENIVPELHELADNWDNFSSREKGEKTGYIIGKYGVDILAPACGVKAFKAYRDMRRANVMLTLEHCTVSPSNQAAIVSAANARSLQRAHIVEKLKIRWGHQGKHIPGHHNFDPERGKITIPVEKLEAILKKHAGSGQRVIGDKPFTSGYKERIDFGEIIGEYVRKEGGVIVRQEPTSKGILIYSNKGVHLVPSNPGGIVQ